MKQLFRGLCLLLCFHAYALSQPVELAQAVQAVLTESITPAISEATTDDENWQPFGVSVDSLEGNAVYESADGVVRLSGDDLARQESIVAFVSDSGLYAGFGTAWHRNYPTRYAKEMQFSPIISTTTEINLSSLFKTTLVFDDGMDIPSFQSFSTVFTKPLVQVSFGYRNSF